MFKIDKQVDLYIIGHQLAFDTNFTMFTMCITVEWYFYGLVGAKNVIFSVFRTKKKSWVAMTTANQD